jgi:PAS domain S-box-containing protein
MSSNESERGRLEIERLRIEVQRVAEAAARRTAELDAIIDSAADAIVIYGTKGEILRRNAAATRLLPYSEPEWRLPMSERLALGRFRDEHGRPLGPEETALMRAAGGAPVSGEITQAVATSGEMRWFSVSAGLIRGPEGEALGAVSIFADVTQRHRLEEHLRDVLRTVSHDLRTPLSVVAAQAGILLRRSEAPEEALARVRLIKKSADRMAAMLDELVYAALVDTGQLEIERERIDPRTFLGELGARLRGAIAMDRVRFELVDPLPSMLADPAKLERVVVNLLTNALKYSPEGTEVTVRAEPDAAGVAIVVRDRGVGIAPEDLPRVFERYFRSAAGPRKPEGLGLGLFITRALVEAQGGTITATSRLGAGSEFRVVLAASDRSSSAAR